MNISLPPEFIVAGIWLWETFSKDIIKGLASSTRARIDKEWDKFEWSLAAKNYRENVYNLYSTMRVLGNPNPVPLEGIYTDVRILDEPTAFRRHNIEYLKASYSARGYIDEIHNETIDALKLIQKQRRLFVLGKPGAGKTTLLKYVTLLAAKGIIDKVPIFISLNDWAQSSSSIMSQHDLMSHIVRQFEICSFPNPELFIEEGILKEGRAIVLFDGLDEVNEESYLRNQVIRLLTDFTNQYHKNTFIITCRVAATDFVFEKFPYVEIADFTREQINMFVSKWFSSFPQKGERFMKEINHLQNEGLYELAKTPILLTLLCVNFDETLTFPAKKNEIYQEAIEALLKKWDASRNIKRDEVYRGLSVLRKRQMLSRIAAEFFQEREIFFTTQEIVRRLQMYLETLPEMQDESIDGEIVLRAMEAQHGILVERAHDIHSFSHLSLQEYFTSQYIVETASEKILQQLMEYVLIGSWRDVFLMVAGALPNADIFFQAYLKKQKAIIGKMQTMTRLREALLSVPDLTLSQRFAIIMLMQEYRNCFKKSQMNHIRKILKELQSTIEYKLERNIDEQLADVRSILFKLSKKVTRLRPDREHKGLSKVEIIFGRVKDLFETDETVEFCRERATQINNNLEKIELWLQQLEARQPIPNNNISIQIEKRTIKDGLLDIERSLEVVSQCLGEIHNQLGTDIAGRKWHNAFTTLDRAEFLTYLSLNQLLLECVRVSAVSDRPSLLANALLPY